MGSAEPLTGRSVPRRVVAIVGMPRSGTSWLGQIADSCPEVRFRLSPLFSYELKNRVGERSSPDDWRRMLAEAYASDSRFMDQTERREAGRYPRFVKGSPRPPVLVFKMTRFHQLIEGMLRKLPELKLVAVVRHPCGAIHSWLTTPREFPPHADPLRHWRGGACRKTAPEEFWGFEDWKSVTRMHVRLERDHPDQVRIVRYEDLVDDAERWTKRLFDFLDLPFERQTLDFLHASQRRHDDDTHAVFKHPRVARRWRTELQPSIRTEIENELRGGDLERFLR